MAGGGGSEIFFLPKFEGEVIFLREKLGGGGQLFCKNVFCT